MTNPQYPTKDEFELWKKDLQSTVHHRMEEMAEALWSRIDEIADSVEGLESTLTDKIQTVEQDMESLTDGLEDRVLDLEREVG